eukprot:CAMPEP_0116882308 /NCGR_PEP_ID=MMETSP0463-20121206/14511_1 /TAXON_ID=181622 /ORGANISM="Strombidinopsis sp, Strain SopsisLIS2011" /LENGTH=78 /DNA_ID=CAMNT_0004535305 /DNA_START=140 /DNA_END=376 /DNA_ORIENTATION=+
MHDRNMGMDEDYGEEMVSEDSHDNIVDDIATENDTENQEFRSKMTIISSNPLPKDTSTKSKKPIDHANSATKDEQSTN